MADCCCISTLGYLALGYILFRSFKNLRTIFYAHIFAKRLGHVVNLTTYGKWAVITGSTDGIGKGYAKELARRGMNVFLISRSQSKLEETAKEIREHSTSKNVEVRTLAFDFSANTVQAYDVIKQALNGLEVGVLVNNVGVSYDCPDYFDSYSGGEKFCKMMIDVNCSSLVEMTYIVLPQMIKRQKGVIINLSSAAAFSPLPLLSLYSATKTFVRFFTHGLIGEYADKGIVFQSVHPYYVATKMSKIKRASWFAPDPTYYAQSALNTVGIENETTGCLSHAIQHAILELIPGCVFTYLSKKICMQTRQKYLAKAAKSQ
jgi:17beta-estradiol 17-dehydrogenase / very-long-chain 3-oxoacyl-CoA reductase